MPAQIIPYYRTGTVGSGGIGAVYRTQDRTVHRTVTLKFPAERGLNSAIGGQAHFVSSGKKGF